MTKQEQIEEMAVIGCVRNPQAHTAEECAKCNFKKGQCNAYRHSEALYNAGYRKTFTSDLAVDKMKTKQEQIAEIAKERNEIKDIMKLLDKCVSLNPMCKSEVASVLYENNYRKAEEVRKETAKEILSRIKLYATDSKADLIALIDEIAEANGVEVQNDRSNQARTKEV